MTLPLGDAERALRARLGDPVKEPTEYVVGFKTAAGRVLAMHRDAAQTRIWFLPPAPPPIEGVRLMPRSALNSNLNGELAPLNGGKSLRAEIDSESALHRFLDWYSLPSSHGAQDGPQLDREAFHAAFDQFCKLIEFNSGGHAFTNFREGLAAVWESYKPRVRTRALELLDLAAWRSEEIGSGSILERAIAAIEIDERGRNLINNLVFWQNRYGHANRDHRALLEARTDTRLRAAIEQQLFALYRGEADEGATFDRLAELTYANYPLLAYLFFLKDMDRFMPIRPTTFDRAFHDLNIDLVTVGRCSWENYTRYNAALGVVRDALRQEAGVADARLIDAHSFCWMLERMEAPEPGSDGQTRQRGPNAGHIYGPREKSIWEMKDSVVQTVKQANGQIVERQLKIKELRMSERELETLIRELMERQDDRCALTGLPLQFKGAHDDLNLLPSLDRIDSAGHYERGNLQVVCRFVNFWKQDSDNEEFKRLLMLVRGGEE